MQTFCRHFLRNKCKYGINCKYSHDSRDIIIQKRKKNTVCFIPDNNTDLRLQLDLSNDKCNLIIKPNDVIISPCIFTNTNIYNDLITELKSKTSLYKLWHGNHQYEGTHYIADDTQNWKKDCPTFNMIVHTLSNHFNMKINTTRLNIYDSTSQWKPYHHDQFNELQNFTVAVSFGTTRSIAFQNDNTQTVISIPQNNGCVYSFAKGINENWRHGVLQENPPYTNETRFSIICWGYITLNE